VWAVESLQNIKMSLRGMAIGESYLPLSCVQSVLPFSLPLRLSGLRFLFAGLVLPYLGDYEQQ
jgi:hypothetical protein